MEIIRSFSTFIKSRLQTKRNHHYDNIPLINQQPSKDKDYEVYFINLIQDPFEDYLLTNPPPDIKFFEALKRQETERPICIDNERETLAYPVDIRGKRFPLGFSPILNRGQCDYVYISRSAFPNYIRQFEHPQTGLLFSYLPFSSSIYVYTFNVNQRESLSRVHTMVVNQYSSRSKQDKAFLIGVGEHRQENEREITTEEGIELASQFGIGYCEVQIDTGMNVQECMDMIAGIIHEKNPSMTVMLDLYFKDFLIWAVFLSINDPKITREDLHEWSLLTLFMVEFGHITYSAFWNRSNGKRICQFR
ncbi:hypothetical protein FGO68_gene1814 [Halteria grandinella]|uniref:Uncharacterized protein n=1 Tax=Halteria grandinella TaxID=5974 RepID=A0A8J8NND3_HALGN|nr:hypothetical protein FGO68_gene1814 [Halteria grandinella]